MLDIIIIGKNEEKTLPRVFTSVLIACKIFEKHYKASPSIIYIDSNSTDGSVGIAEQYGIPYKVIRGKTSPAIGRIAGARRTRSKYIFFLDGDTCVDEDWLIEGVKYLEQNINVAGVGGQLHFKIYDEDNKLIWEKRNYRGNKKDIESIYDGVGGTFLYRRNVYEESGGFSNKYSIGEEFDLLLRIIALNKKVYRINKPMAVHYDYKTHKDSFLSRYLLTKNIFTPGMICRKAPKTVDTIIVMLKRFWLNLLHLPFLILLLCLALFGVWIWLIVFALILFFLHFMYKKFSLMRTIVSIFSMSFYSLGFYYGFLKS